MADSFVFYQPVKIYFGFGKLQELENIFLENQIESCVLVCDSFFKDKATELSEKYYQIKAIFSDVEPNPQLSGVETTAKLLEKFNSTAVIALGGGSSIDTAKFAAACAYSLFTPKEHYDGKQLRKNQVKIIAIPTTAGTGSEVTQVAVISNGEDKKTIHDKSFMPTACIVDPELTLSVPKKMTMITGLDALAHAIEGYWSKKHQPICDLFSIEAVKLIRENLEEAYKSGSVDARTNMSYASLLAGLSFAQSKTAACHACSYPLSMYYHLPHGEACAFTLDSFININNSERLEYLAVSAGYKNSEDMANHIRYLKKLSGLKTTMNELSDNVDVDLLSKESAEHMLMKNNPVELSADMLKDMFMKLYE